MKNIVERQSSDQAIEVAAAFRKAYQKAKFWNSLTWKATLLLSIVQTIAALFINKFYSFSYSEELSATLVLIATVTLLLNTFGDHFKMTPNKKLGNELQRLHDTLILESKDIITESEIRASDIKKMSESWLTKNPSDYENLKEWWPNSCIEVPEPYTQTLCLLSTITWEKELRKKYFSVLIFATSILFSTLLLFGFVLKLTVWEFSILIITPNIPLFGLLIKEILKNNELKTDASRHLQSCNELWKNRKLIKKIDYKERQDEILHQWHRYRADDTIIPEYLYRKAQANMNKDMITDVDDLVSKFHE